ncbi:ammonium transporter [Dongia deserti]|uniref:ammonium transporter n=1 Tax=Dongia deserti TaxID=2268030 RepID=UPI0013C4ECF4|nr:ammonium transporter [Dongia deserti]
MLRLGLRRGLTGIIAALAGTLAAVPALAQEPTIDSGATAWMMTSTALVLLMTIPGLALFYAGMVRKMNVLAIVMQSFAICCLVTILWMVVGYSIAFSEGTAFFGGLSNLFLKNLEVGSVSGSIPESVFMIFQMTFAIITPALITGAFADRMKFSAMLIFISAWSVLIYAPLTHMVWAGGGLMFDWGVLDFAGGTVVHISSGVSGLVAALMIGKRNGYRKIPFVPHNLVYTVIGGSMLWVGWFGFNAGSALAASPNAGMAMVVTQIAAAAAALAWMFCEWGAKGQPSILGIVSGAVAGLVGITPASGFVDPTAALVIGAAAGVGCFLASTAIKNALGYDDALDAFGVHGVGGTIGAILTGVFATMAVTGASDPVGMIDGNAGQILTQILGVVTTVVFVGIGTAVILKVVDLTVGLRVSEEVERDGLDLALHGEAVQ